ncbi:MAG: hypothetical protein R3F42_11900 [Pseudomonadota bacterium]
MTLLQLPVRRIAVWLLLPVFVLHSGCAGLQVRVPTTDWQDTLGRVAVVSAGHAADIRFEGFAHGRGEGAAQGAGTTFLACMGGLGQGGSCSGEFCGAVMIIMLGICTTAGVIGGVVGAGTAQGAGAVQQREQLLAGMLQPATIQDTLVHRVATRVTAAGGNLAQPPVALLEQARAGQDYRVLAAAGVDTVVEVALTRAGTAGGGINAPVRLVMQAQVRVVRTADNSARFSADYEYAGPALKLQDWSADRGRALQAGLEAGYAALGSHIHDSIFLLYPFPDRSMHAAGVLAGAFGLAPLAPATRGQLTGTALIGDAFEWTRVDSLHPTLRWQSFPRAGDLEQAPDLAGRIRNVRYDLVIARERNLAPAAIVYWREGLLDAAHTVQDGLQADSRYFWTVRARFDLDGRERVTEWATTNYLAQERLTSPSSYSYRFRTP